MLKHVWVTKRLRSPRAYCNSDQDVLLGLAGNHRAAIWTQSPEGMLDCELVIAALQTNFHILC